MWDYGIKLTWFWKLSHLILCNSWCMCHMMHYMPIIPRIKQLFLTKSKAMLMDWHVANKSEDGVMRGPANSKTWQIVEDRWPQFKEEPRHLTLGLAIDGVNPYSLQQSKYSVWPIVVLDYNLPPHLTMNNAFMWFAFIIPGRRQVHNMDIYLQPLIDELQLLWT